MMILTRNQHLPPFSRDSADENCPIVYGAEARIPIKYEDPKNLMER